MKPLSRTFLHAIGGVPGLGSIVDIATMEGMVNGAPLEANLTDVIMDYGVVRRDAVQDASYVAGLVHRGVVSTAMVGDEKNVRSSSAVSTADCELKLDF